jgi:hypothetical protein
MTDERTGAELIAAERKRQMSEEGWTPGHDDGHAECELVCAAACYLNEHAKIPTVHSFIDWPWDLRFWKPSDDPIRNLVKAGALIAAEIDRLKRLEEQDDGR